MRDVAYIFPGQGAQYVGMGRDLHESYPEAKDVFDQANRALGFDIARLCFEGPAEELTKTENCQPAILTVSIAALKAFLTKYRKDIKPRYSLGLSLGEYTALVASSALAFDDAVVLVRKRGLYMEEAAREFPGTMASVLGMEAAEVEKIAAASGVEIANLNCPGQVVISGSREDVENACAAAKERGAKRCIPLDVSGPFHSSRMASAAQKLKTELEKIKIFPPEIPVICNVNARTENDPAELKENLIDQVSSTTHWEDSIRQIDASGVKTYLEIGPGTVLKGLLRRIDPALEVINLCKKEEIESFVG